MKNMILYSLQQEYLSMTTIIYKAQQFVQITRAKQNHIEQLTKYSANSSLMKHLFLYKLAQVCTYVLPYKLN